jgi:hypothetical protein
MISQKEHEIAEESNSGYIFLSRKKMKNVLNEDNLIFDGLVHRIYLAEDIIYKIPKDTFKEFHQEEHFIIEREALCLLNCYGIPTPKTFGIIPKCPDSGEKPILVEQLIKGIQKSKEDLNEIEQKNIINLIKKAHEIKLEGYGRFTGKAEGEFSSWQQYIDSLFQGAKTYFSKNNLIDSKNMKTLQTKMEKYSCILQYNEKGSFIFLDINPGNIFFNNNGEIIGVIDIDHPAVGDPLYDFACLKWYNPKMFEKQRSSLYLNKNQMHKIIRYELIQGMEAIRWMHSHNLDINEDISRLIELINN